MNQGQPFGLKYTKAVNLISVFLFVLIALLLATISFTNFVRAAQDAGRPVNLEVLMVSGIAGLVTFGIFFLPALILILLNKGLSKRNKKARMWQIILSCFFLLGFPLGTVLYGISLYFMLFDSKTKAVFETVS